MTQNQLAYQANLEAQRANRAREAENYRSNVARERENERSNRVKEGIQRAQVVAKTATDVGTIASKLLLG